MSYWLISSHTLINRGPEENFTYDIWKYLSIWLSDVKCVAIMRNDNCRRDTNFSYHSNVENIAKKTFKCENFTHTFVLLYNAAEIYLDKNIRSLK